MSYDVHLRIDTGGAEPVAITEYHCPTYNLAPMFKYALGFGLRELDGRLAGVVIHELRRAIAAMQNDPRTFKGLNPPNGWGSYEGALEFLQNFLKDCLEHPKATVHI